MKRLSLFAAIVLSIFFLANVPSQAQAAGSTTVGNDRASSVRVLRGSVPAENVCDGREGVYLYEDTQYRGRCAKFTVSVPDLSDLGFGNIVSSIAFVGDWTATLYVDQNYSGASVVFTQDDPDLANNIIGNDRASSLLVQRGSVPGGNICDGGEGVYLYEHPFYQGRCVRFTGDAPDLRVFGFDDIASSVAFVGNWTVTLYRDLSGTGIASTFTQSTPYLGDYAVGDNHVTSLQARRR
jgi:hypothetical protein